MDVRARQIGNNAEVWFQVPEPRGSKPKQQLGRAELVRITYPPGVEAPPDPDAFRRRGELVAQKEGAPLPSGVRIGLVDDSLDQLPGAGTGYTLRYAVRIRDYRGRSSPLVVGEDLVPATPAPAPRSLRAEPTADGVRLTWQAPEGEGPFQYNVYRSQPDGPPAGSPLNSSPLTGTEFLDESAATGSSYVYVVRVALADGPPYREGWTCDPLELVAEDRFAPASPQGLVAVQEGKAVRLFWNPNSERDLGGYRVYRRVNGGPWTRLDPPVVEQPLYLDADVEVGQRLAYRIAAIDRAVPPNEGEPSAAVELDLLDEPVETPGAEP
jgi:hypothetical protein